MILCRDPAGGRVRKRATTADERVRLAREADVLAVVAHPGLVRLLDAGPGWIELAEVRGWCLSDVGPLPPVHLAGIGAALATVVADLHELGLTHGGIEGTHVLLDEECRPVLCSPGRAHAGAGPAARADDVHRVVDALRRAAPSGPPSPARCPARWPALRPAWPARRRPGPGVHPVDPVSPILARAASRGRPDARRLADRLARAPGACLPTW